jgi:hypothetical protein
VTEQEMWAANVIAAYDAQDGERLKTLLVNASDIPDTTPSAAASMLVLRLFPDETNETRLLYAQALTWAFTTFGGR